MQASEIMTTNPITVSPKDTILTALELCKENDIRHLPVVDDGVIIGMISTHDLAGMSQVNLQSAFVREIMNTALILVDQESSTEEMVELMIENKVGALPVIDPSSSKLLGIISYVDLLKAMLDKINEISN